MKQLMRVVERQSSSVEAWSLRKFLYFVTLFFFQAKAKLASSALVRWEQSSVGADVGGSSSSTA